jgi:hypothetical protein
MATNASKVAALALAARLLSDHADAPTICTVSAGNGYDPVTDELAVVVRFQLAATVAVEELRDVALWAQRLATGVTFSLSGDDVRLDAIAMVDGVRVEVWTYVPVEAVRAAFPPDLAARCLAGTTVPPGDVLSALA